MTSAVYTHEALSKRQQAARSRRAGSVNLFLCGLVLIFLVTTRKLLFVWGIPVPMRAISQIGGVLSFALLVSGMAWFNRQFDTRVRLLHTSKVLLWQALLIVFFIYGVIRGNSFTVAGKELIALWFFASVWITGANDQFWHSVTKMLTVMFYLAVPLILMTANTVAPVTSFSGTEEAEYQFVGVRGTNTLANEFRPLISSGMFLGIWGMVNVRGGKWRIWQIAALFVAFAIQVGMFKFRSSSVFYAAAIASVLFLRPILESRIRMKTTVTLVALSSIGLAGFMLTDSSRDLLNRFLSPNESIFASRTHELSAYLSSMGTDIIIGRGLGGTYNAETAIGTETAKSWRTVHFGLFVFSLKGGVLLMGVFLSILLAGFIPRRKAWYQNPCNMTAALMFPVLLMQFSLVPFGLSPTSIFSYLAPMMVLARFGK